MKYSQSRSLTCSLGALLISLVLSYNPLPAQTFEPPRPKTATYASQLSGVSPTVSYLYGDVTVAGTGLSAVSELTLDHCTSGRDAVILANTLGAQTIITRAEGSVTFRVVNGVWWKPTLRCDVAVAGPFGADTLHQALTIDYLPVITGVNKTKVNPGDELTFTGRNLNGPIRGFMSTTLPNAPGNPPSTTTNGFGNYVHVRVPPDCFSSGYPQIELFNFKYAPASPVSGWLTASWEGPGQVVECRSIPVVNSFQNNPVNAGTALFVSGKYLNQVDEVSIVSGQPLVFHKYPADGSGLQVNIPPTAESMTAGLNIRTAVASSGTPAVTIVGAPRILAILPQDWVEAGGVINLQGNNFPVTGNYLPILIGGVQSTTYPSTSQPFVSTKTQIFAAVPAGIAASDSIAIEFSPAIVPATYRGLPRVIAGPTIIDSIRPASAPVGAKVVAYGKNLLRVSAFCWSGGSVFAYPAAPVTNSVLTFTVPQGATSGWLAVLLQPRVGINPQTTACLPTRVMMKVG